MVAVVLPNGSDTPLMATGVPGNLIAPSGTRILFQQSTAPVGWTTVSTFNDAALRIVSSSPGSGGTNSFSSFCTSQNTVDSHVLTQAEMPSHTHVVNDPGHFHNEAVIRDGGLGSSPVPASSNNTGTGFGPITSSAFTGIANQTAGGGGGHVHTVTFGIKYVDAIICSKN